MFSVGLVRVLFSFFFLWFELFVGYEVVFVFCFN